VTGDDGPESGPDAPTGRAAPTGPGGDGRGEDGHEEDADGDADDGGGPVGARDGAAVESERAVHGRARYLSAKRSVDDRARSDRVRERLLAAVPSSPRVVEAGCGLGFAVPTLRSWGVEPRSYLGVDADAGTVALARHLLPRVLRRRGVDARETPAGCRVDGADLAVAPGDALRVLPAAARGRADLLLAQSVLDLVPPWAFVETAERTLAPGGVGYAALTFDGETTLCPAHPEDERVLAAFHASIDGEPGRHARAGRRLVEAVRARGHRLLAVDRADWVVRPVEGSYPADEQWFLAAILAVVAGAVDDADDWLAARRRQLAAGTLSYRARNLDVCWRVRE
jgi:SAM-dependent methyltransferase